jgi:hypothetical protein
MVQIHGVSEVRILKDLAAKVSDRATKKRQLPAA